MKYIFSKSNILLGFVMLLTVQAVVAQQLPYFNQYIFNPYLQNPARAGSSPFATLYAGYRHQWDQMPENPRTGFVSGDARIGEGNSAIGGFAMIDRTHILKNTSAQVSYAYRIPFNKRKTNGLAIGVSGGLFNQQIDFSKVQFIDQQDPAIYSTNATGATFNTGAGMNLFLGNFNLGASCFQAFGNKLWYSLENNDKITYQLQRYFFASTSYRAFIGKKKSFSIEPIISARYFNEKLPIQLDGNLVLNLKDAFWLSGGYRTTDDFEKLGSANASLGMRIAKQFSVSYNVERPIQNTLTSSYGYSHEVLVGYRFGSKHKDKEFKALEQKVDSLYGLNKRLRNKLEDTDTALAEQSRDLSRLRDSLNQVYDRLGKAEKLIQELSKNGGQKQSKNGLFKKLGSIYFPLNQFSLTTSADADVTALADLLKTKSPDALVYVIGSASIEGTPQYNLLLSTKRASMVKKELVESGVKQNIIVSSVGAEVPDNEKDLPKNRRVDIYISAE